MCVVSQFGLDFFSKADLEAVVNVDKVKALQQKLLQADKKNEQLAHNARSWCMGADLRD